jgi:hypothetical protein
MELEMKIDAMLDRLVVDIVRQEPDLRGDRKGLRRAVVDRLAGMSEQDDMPVFESIDEFHEWRSLSVIRRLTLIREHFKKAGA